MKGFEDDGIEVLAVDDDVDLLELSKLFLEKNAEGMAVTTTSNPTEIAEQVASGDYDAVVSDYNMPEMNGIEVLEGVREIDENFPFILYTGEGTEDVAQEAISKGVTNYQQKESSTDHYAVLAKAIEDSVEGYRNRTQNEIFRELVEQSENPTVITNSDSEIVYVNDAFERVNGYDEEEVIGRNPNILNAGVHPEELFEEMYESLQKGETFRVDDMVNVNRLGEEYNLSLQLIPVTVNRDSPDYYVSIADVEA